MESGRQLTEGLLSAQKFDEMFAGRVESYQKLTEGPLATQKFDGS